MSWINMEKINFDKNSLRKFGIIMGIAFSLIGLLVFLKGRHSFLPAGIIALLFFLSALVCSVILKPVYVFWMRLAFVLSWINTRIILFLIFYLTFTPIGLVLRLFRVDLLDKKINKSAKTYWRKKEKISTERESYERQF